MMHDCSRNRDFNSGARDSLFRKIYFCLTKMLREFPFCILNLNVIFSSSILMNFGIRWSHFDYESRFRYSKILSNGCRI